MTDRQNEPKLRALCEEWERIADTDPKAGMRLGDNKKQGQHELMMAGQYLAYATCAKALRAALSAPPEPPQACPHYWGDGNKAWGCVLPKGHAGEHSAVAVSESEKDKLIAHLTDKLLTTHDEVEYRAKVDENAELRRENDRLRTPPSPQASDLERAEWIPGVEIVRKEMMRQLSDKLSMDEVANVAYAVAHQFRAESAAAIVEKDVEVEWLRGEVLHYRCRHRGKFKRCDIKSCSDARAALAQGTEGTK